jgi:hypothetical protein
MSRIPSIIRTGTNNSNRPPSQLLPGISSQNRGPAVTREQFSTSGLDPNVARALQQIQTNMANAHAQARGFPLNNCNVLERVPVVIGGNLGAPPYTIIQHGLGTRFRGYFILANYGSGTITGHVVIPNAITIPNQPSPMDDTQIQLWISVQLFQLGGPGYIQPNFDILVYA